MERRTILSMLVAVIVMPFDAIRRVLVKAEIEDEDAALVRGLRPRIAEMLTQDDMEWAMRENEELLQRLSDNCCHCGAYYHECTCTNNAITGVQMWGHDRLGAQSE